MSLPLLDFRVQRKAFAGHTVLQDVHLQLAEGEVVSLLGPSGCGKSTLLRIVAGLERDYSGQALRGEGEVAFVFQEPRLMPWLTVAENIGFADDRAYDRPRVAQLIREVGLEGFEQALPKQLSGGMAQRVAIARGLYSRPRVLLLDEPFSAVDAFTRMKLQDLLLALAAHHGIALLLVTHDVDEALYLGDRVLVMGSRPGRVLETLEVPLARPRDRRDPLLAQLRAEALTALHRAHAF
ncbi:ABC transporter ATP-binding protein [Metapseudomonas otitidis]|uniref:Aliphatic sulfonates import ATP-binding protein SsuB 2 n=1 Tax=Metapseudomonas otitidis TaxID=319939 RepID=A0A1I0UNQ7_9GAMM|nr:MULTISPECIES: ABC transporter ATP-binding protein [Pseudomonas]MDL5600460.1 ABC transporter ATP-binding protein [Bacillus subtilis]MDI6524064.1 ABC transporter ATP-binding protein [Pseudomonas otitidis]QZX85274.1 ABC transporter ATP-binding protein [Pseudomonas otitidis]WIF69656.1 ABC transporter ATP-binding protein [Pseudomonas otitidis]SFA65550.1 sulfonate transport system ATP-binding protein [Pseudomonas otitidis]